MPIARSAEAMIATASPSAAPGRVLLFDIGVSGDFVTDFTSQTRERRQDGTFAGRENRLFPREVDLALFGRVDPYAGAVVRISSAKALSGTCVLDAPGTKVESCCAFCALEVESGWLGMLAGT